VVTAHGPTKGEPGRYYAALADRVALVAIYQAQRRLLPDVAWSGVVHYGVPVGQHPYRADKQDFALFLGRMGPDKAPTWPSRRPGRAVGMPLVLAAKCSEPAELPYFEQQVLRTWR
jgi:hypothetical protein